MTLTVRTRTIDRTGAFPTAPRSTWTPAQLERWQTARSLADATPGNRPGGWTDEACGHFPGTYRAIAIWVASPVAALAVLHLGLDRFGQTGAAYLAAAVGVLLFAAGALVHLHVWGGYRPGTPEQQATPTTRPVDRLAVPAGRRSTRTEEAA